MEQSLDVQRDHPLLLERALGLCATGGVVYFSTNLRSFRLAADGLDYRSLEEITDRTVPPDFGQRRPHRCWRLVK